MSEPTVAAALQAAAVRIAKRDAEVLLADILQVTRASLFAFPEKPLSREEASRFQIAVSACAAGTPVAYLTGWREFWSLTLRVTPDTLIPRPDTERLVEAVLERLPPESARIADCGTGSGAIALALASERPHWIIHATDCSAAALAVAKDNAFRIGISNVFFHCGHWCAALPDERFDAIVSNPPYLAENDTHLSSLREEPRLALVSGKDGLDAIREIVGSAGACLRPVGWLLVEHGHDQGAQVRCLFSEAGYSDITTLADLAGHDRVTAGRRRG